MTPPKSILHPEWRGVAKITGYRGVGKSAFASQIENPALTAFFDFEKKGEGINAQIHFGLYVPVTERASGGGAYGIYDTLIKEIENIERDQFTHAILDNTAPLELAMKAESARNAEKYEKQFGISVKNIRTNSYGAQGGVVNYLISEAICNVLWSKGIKLITVTSHIKPRWAGGVQVINSFNVKGADRWDELSMLTLVLIPGKFAPVPAALVMKEQLGVLAFDGETFTVHRRLPYRLPKATPAELIKYLEKPADLDKPAEGEMPSEEEVQPFREKLAKEQIKIVLAEIEKEKERTSEESAAVEGFSISDNGESVLERLKRQKSPSP